MDFNHTSDRQMLADTLARFVADRYAFATRQRAAESALGYDAGVWIELSDLGMAGALFGPSSGGFGGSGFDLMVMFEQIGRGLMVEPFLAALMAGRTLEAVGGCDALVTQIAAGMRFAFAHQEPAGRYGMTHVATMAMQDGDGWILNGEKSVVAQIESAETILVSARTSGATDEVSGISLFLVPRDTAGVSIRGYGNIDGGRSGELSLADVKLPADALAGAVGGGSFAIGEGHAAGLFALSAEAVGIMDVMRDMTVDYLRTRTQFGMPIGSFQALQHRMATLLIEIEQARSSVINAAAAMDGGASIARDRMLAAAKYTVGRVGTLVAEEAIQMHGGIGMTWELPLPHYAKRLVMIGHLLGDEDHHLQRFMHLRTA